MLALIKGQVILKRPNYLILENQGLGYKIFIAPEVLAELNKGDEASFFVYHNIKEDAEDLYGFNSFEDLEMFEMLISVSGIGPKSGLSLMSLTGTEHLKSSIISGDVSLLTKVSGVGKKTAERVVLELKEKIGKLESEIQSPSLGANSRVLSDEIDALMSLGYSLQEAREVLKKVDKDITDSAQRVKEALKYIG
ncbi:MAG: Holliday junction branch migration protein RuvA [Candidatus Pacebacteria bacterium]|nr:Holliday junction branch migration protein RuvA [Candidatus Paceibacterota bacterium]